MKQHEISPCIRMQDSSLHRVSASWLVRSATGRDPASQEARLANQFIHMNRGILGDFGVTAEVSYDGQRVSIDMQSSLYAGALPLRSPVSGQPDLGLLIEPRFPWSGVGPMMGKMGWRVIPKILPYPLLPRSAVHIPRWVLSATILVRLKALLDRMERRFEIIDAELSAPRGTVNWQRYATRNLPRAAFLNVPSRIPSLRNDADLLAGIHHSLLKQRESLASQMSAGVIVSQLLELCQSQLLRVSRTPPRMLPGNKLESRPRSSLSADVFREGIQAIEWTEEERGLAGMSDLQGLPWRMPMEAFFESWVETLVCHLARKHGGLVRTGRNRQTVSPLEWDPPYVGSQRSLVPDIVYENGDSTVIVDAKYKKHWDELNRSGWSNLAEVIREHHREDLLQVLAYANLPVSKDVVVVLVYPCSVDAWAHANQRQRAFHVAELRGGLRRIRVVLTAVPMDVRFTDEVSQVWFRLLNPACIVRHQGATG